MGLPKKVVVGVVLALAVQVMAGCVIRYESEEQDSDQEVPPELRDLSGWPPIDQATIRPGTVVLGPAERQGVMVQREQCTAAFVFTDPNNTSLYVATGAHCFADARLGDEVQLAGGDAVGTLVYCSFGAERGDDTCPAPQDADDPFNDFALVEVSERHRPLVHPAVLLLGGPTGFGEERARGTPVHIYANSAQRDTSPGEGPEEDDLRHGRIASTREDTLLMALDRPIMRGDSGSPVLDGAGRAVGILQFAGQYRDCPGDEQDIQGATDLLFALEHMHRHSGLEVVLATWPLETTLVEPPPLDERCA